MRWNIPVILNNTVVADVFHSSLWQFFSCPYNHLFLSDVQLHSCLIATYRTHYFLVHVTNNLTLGIPVKSGEEDNK